MEALSQEAALQALRRLIELLQDPETPRADVIKASSLIFDRVYAQPQADSPAGGDFEICVKED